MLELTTDNFYEICDVLASRDDELKDIISKHGYPPFWQRPNTFESLTHIILEQQVSLASALAALKRLQQRTGQLTPQALLQIGDDEFTGLYVSRQKRVYIQRLAREIDGGKLNLNHLEAFGDDQVRARLLQLKGIGNWTVDVYLIMVLHRVDHFPIGDIAAVTALKQLKNLPRRTDEQELTKIVDTWQPYRSVATMLLWHYYLSERKKSQ